METEPLKLFRSAWQQMVSDLPGTNIGHDNGITSCFCDVPNLFFNVWMHDGPVSDEAHLRRLLREGKARSASWHQTSGGLLREDWLPLNWENVLADEGMAVMMPMLGMEADAITPPPRALAEIDIRQITDDDMALQAMLINAHAYGMPEEQFAPCGGMFFFPEGTLGFVGYIDGKPVATTGIRLVEDTIYVLMVATEPEEQAKGFAAAVMRHAMAEGARLLGKQRFTLHATIAGSKTYQKMGFVAGPRTTLIIPAG